YGIVHSAEVEAERARALRRQRHIAPGLHRIELARNEHYKLPGILDAAGNAGGFVAGAEINIGARGADDGRAGILRDNEAVEFRLRLLVCNRQFGFDEEWGAIGVQRAIDRDRPAGNEFYALAADRFVFGGEIGDAEEDV